MMSPRRNPARSAGEPGLTSFDASALHRAGGRRFQIFQRNPDAPALDPTALRKLIHHLSRHVDRHRKADADVAAARRDDRRVDADQFAPQVDQAAAGITGIDRCIGLDEIFIAMLAKSSPPQCADEAGRDGLAETEGIADRDHEVADLERIAITQRNGLQPARLPDLQQRDIGRRIAADHPACELAPFLGPDLNRRGVGDDIAALRVDDHARAGRVDLLSSCFGTSKNSRNTESW